MQQLTIKMVYSKLSVVFSRKKDFQVWYIKNADYYEMRIYIIIAFYRGTIPVLCIVGPRISLQYMGLAFYKPIFEKFEERSILPAHSSAGLAGVCTGITQAVTLGKIYQVY